MKKIIQPFFGGLGDSLQFSTLPRRLTEQGHEVYISSATQYRNEGIKQLVWDKNPYIKGESSDPANAGDTAVPYRNDHKGFISSWERVHGLEAPYSYYPEVYYTPNFRENLRDTILIDISATSLFDDYNKKQLKRFIHTQYGDKLVIVLNNGSQLLKLEDFVHVTVPDIFAYCDMIHSCKKFVCLFSGGSVLASALGAYTDCIVTHHPKTHSCELQGLYFFDNINYIWI